MYDFVAIRLSVNARKRIDADAQSGDTDHEAKFVSQCIYGRVDTQAYQTAALGTQTRYTAPFK
jgi:hypothetical protein